MNGFIDYNTARLHYQILGNDSAPTLVLLHGGLGSSQDFAAILPTLIPLFRIVAIDSRGQGQSTLGTIPLTYAQMADDVAKILGLLNIQHYSVLGFSDGGIVAYRLATSSNNIEKVITIGAHWHIDNLTTIRPMYEAIDEATVRQHMAEQCDHYLNTNPDANLRRLIDSLKTLWLDGSNTGYPNANIQRIQTPVLAIRGEHDFLLSNPDLMALAACTPDTHCMNVPFAAHEVLKEQPEIVLPAILFFLQTFRQQA
ncbi:alpha/beta fold hydrolase [Snodgrassella sp. CFCC 13594]|uniref:alpha/beta fold hydrolase n=1 Tax=Snodgrassella sp. CFCC 13594 TaxID=1775559 RepID=UPI000AAD9F50|nr:alpha/beta hydrolase [Snodgrassella sp. CFCC 13594]